mmetsp:Transcript_52608/g.125655  ORF Transcript_52608/g.125655 Transcript_52608/m.125655 type:complete len:244 (-) Transcript_52608:147-878(-)
MTLLLVGAFASLVGTASTTGSVAGASSSDNLGELSTRSGDDEEALGVHALACIKDPPPDAEEPRGRCMLPEKARLCLAPPVDAGRAASACAKLSRRWLGDSTMLDSRIGDNGPTHKAPPIPCEGVIACLSTSACGAPQALSSSQPSSSSLSPGSFRVGQPRPRFLRFHGGGTFASGCSCNGPVLLEGRLLGSNLSARGGVLGTAEPCPLVESLTHDCSGPAAAEPRLAAACCCVGLAAPLKSW